MQIIGVVGLDGSGKDEVVKYLATAYGVPLLSAGDMVREIAAKEGIEPTRDNLDGITRRYFERYGEGYFLKLVIEKINCNGWQTAGISGIRSPRDISLVREAFKNEFLLIHVFITDTRVRYERIRQRGSKRDDLTYAEFLRQDQASEELFRLSESIASAGISLSNDGTLSDLHKQVDKLVAEKLPEIGRNRKILAGQIYQASHLEGNFVLRSGQVSNQYFDKYLFAARPDLLEKIASQMLGLVPAGTEVLAGLELGGIPVATALSLKTGLPAAFVRKKAKEYGTCKLAEGAELKNKRVCIIEDVITTGGQVILSATDLRKLGARVESVLCVILRNNSACEILGKEGLDLKALFTMEYLEKEIK
jgi:orotate phosphoribosyltransferase